MISVEEYFTNPTTGEVKPHTLQDQENARDLLARVEAIAEEYASDTEADGHDIDPDTGTEISGTHGGSGDGGFRMHNSTTGTDHSSHRQALGVDKSDQSNAFDDWLTSYDLEGGEFNEKLSKHGLYREAPGATNTWSHLSTRSPHSGRRTFQP